jgi:hypothetical protein
VFLNSDLLLLLELYAGGLKVSVKKKIFFWVCRFGIVALFFRLFCFWALLCCCVCVCVCVCVLCLVSRAKGIVLYCLCCVGL